MRRFLGLMGLLAFTVACGAGCNSSIGGSPESETTTKATTSSTKVTYSTRVR